MFTLASSYGQCCVTFVTGHGASPGTEGVRASGAAELAGPRFRLPAVGNQLAAGAAFSPARRQGPARCRSGAGQSQAPRVTTCPGVHDHGAFW